MGMARHEERRHRVRGFVGPSTGGAVEHLPGVELPLKDTERGGLDLTLTKDRTWGLVLPAIFRGVVERIVLRVRNISERRHKWHSQCNSQGQPVDQANVHHSVRERPVETRRVRRAEVGFVQARRGAQNRFYRYGQFWGAGVRHAIHSQSGEIPLCVQAICRITEPHDVQRRGETMI